MRPTGSIRYPTDARPRPTTHAVATTDIGVREIEMSEHTLTTRLKRPRVRVLGPVEVIVDGSKYPLRPMARRLLAVLAAARGRVVRAEQVIDLLWPEGSPVSAAKTLQTHVVHLRRALGQASISYRSAGYGLAVDVVELDSSELERCMERADRGVRAGRFEDAFDDACVAMSLVYGVPFDEFATEEFAAAEVARLSELASRSIELGADCAIRLGKGSTMVGALEGLVRAEPLRESAWANLVGLLVASGRPSDAIRAGERAIDILQRELGATPGRELADVIGSIRSHNYAPHEEGAAKRWRSEIAVPTVSTVVRERLTRRLGDRFATRLTVLQAGAGFGKSMALAQAFDENRFTRRGEDRYWRCEATESTPSGLAVALCTLFEIPAPPDSNSVPGLIASKVWASAPCHVAIVLDDAHHLWSITDNELILQLLRALPTNGHLVLATRTPVGSGTAQILPDGQLTIINEDDLSFTDDERREFCTLRGVTPTAFDWVWPAMAELAVRGATEPTKYLQEMLRASRPTERQALSAVLMLGGADEELASALLGEPANLHLELTRFPLVARDISGRWTAHAMWTDHLDANGASTLHRHGVIEASRLLSSRNDHGRVVHLLASAGLHEEMIDAMGVACRGFEPAVSYLELNEWLGLIPAALAELPTALLVRAFAMSRGDQHVAQDAMVAAAVALATTTDLDAELNALTQIGRLGIRSGYLPDPGRWYARLQALAEQGNRLAEVITKIGRGVITFEAGDEKQAWEALSSIDLDQNTDTAGNLGDLAKIAAYLGSTSALLLGRVDDALRLADRALTESSASTRSIALQARSFALFARGDLEDSEHLVDDVYRLSVEANFAFNAHAMLAWRAAIQAFAGGIEAAQVTLDGIPDQEEPGAWHALALCLIAIAVGDEPRASVLLQDVALVHTMLDRRVMTLAPALAFVLLPQSHQFWDERDARLESVLGSRHVLSMDAARGLLRARSGEPIGGVGPSLAVPMIRSVLPLRWGIELAVALAAEDQIHSATQIAVSYGTLGARWLQSHRAATGASKRAVVVLRAALPPQPAGAVEVQLVGTGSLRCETGSDVATVLSGGRALELVAYLALHGPVARTYVRAALWPDHIGSEAKLREALHLIRVVTEPPAIGQHRSDLGWLIQADGDHLRLATGQDLRVDVHEVDRLIGEAEGVLAASMPALALERFLDAIGLTDEDDLLRGADVGDWIVPFRNRWRSTVVSVRARAAALLAANGDFGQASELAHRALKLDPGSQIAWCVEIDARINLGDLDGAQKTGERCRAELLRRSVIIEGATVEAIARSGADEGEQSYAR